MKYLALVTMSLALVIGSTQMVAAEETTQDPYGTRLSRGFETPRHEPQAAGLIVELAKPEISDSSITAIETTADVEIVGVTDFAEDIQVVEFSELADSETVQEAAVAAEARKDVVSAEPNWVIRHTALPTIGRPDDIDQIQDGWLGDTKDKRQASLWDPSNPKGNYSINAPEIWKYTTGSSDVTVAVLDSGILPKHPDLAGRLLPGYDFVQTSYWDGIESRDGNGWDANPSDPGDYFYYYDQRGRKKLSPSTWHGTAVASLIAGNPDNKGILGVAPKVKILPVRVLGAGGGTTADLIAAIRWSAGGQAIQGYGLPPNPNPADVINMSLAAYAPLYEYENDKPTSYEGGCEHGDFELLRKAIDDARKQGAVLIAARGNEEDWEHTAPASCPGVIGVAASTRNGEIAKYSNFSFPATDEMEKIYSGTNLAAPGGGGDGYRDKWSINPIWGASNKGTKGPSTHTWRTNMGTSFSAPLVAGAAALMFSMNYGAEDIEKAFGVNWWNGSFLQPKSQPTAVRPGAQDVHEFADCNEYCGAGILDMAKIEPKQLLAKPTISGSAVVGSKLTARTNWTGTLPLVFQWYRGSESISNATASTYTVSLADLNQNISVKVSRPSTTWSAKTIAGVEATSDPTSTIKPPNAAISGTMKKGKTLAWGSSTIKKYWPSEKNTADAWEYTYQWFRENTRIEGATKSTYKLGTSDRGKRIHVQVTITNKNDPPHVVVSTSIQRKTAR